MSGVEIVEKFAVKLEQDDLDKLSLGQVRDMLEEIRHSFQHLTRSQEDLLDALQEEADEDLAQAYWENIEVLEKKKAQMDLINKYLEENDFTYLRHQEHNLPVPPPSQGAHEEEELDDEDGSIANMIASTSPAVVQFAVESNLTDAALAYSSETIAEPGNTEEGVYL